MARGKTGSECKVLAGIGTNTGIIKVTAYRLDSKGDTCRISKKDLMYTVACDNLGACWNITQDSLDKIVNKVTLTTNATKCEVCVNYANDTCTLLDIVFANGTKKTIARGRTGIECIALTGTGINAGTIRVTAYRLDNKGDTCRVSRKNLTYSVNCNIGACCSITKDSLNAKLTNILTGLKQANCELCMPYNLDTCEAIRVTWGDGRDTLIRGRGTLCHIYKGNGNVAVTVTLIRYNGSVECVTASQTKNFDMQSCENLCDVANIKIYNAVSPNSDGLNEVLEIINLQYCGRVDISIYNRWGQLVWSEANYLNTWDGKSIKGEDLPDGTYYLILGLPDLDDKNIRIQTFIDLRRDK